MKVFVLLLLLLTVISCSKQEEDECSSAGVCAENDAPSASRNVNLKIRFNDIHFYDKEVGSFRTISASEVITGNLGERIPVYADFLTLNKTESLGMVAISSIQKDSPNSFSEEDLNPIPYLSINAEEGVTYIYQYKKMNTVGQEVASATGEFLLSGTTAYLPFINEMFDDRFFSATAGGSQTNYTHKIQIAAQSANSIQSETYTVSFSSSLIVPNKDFEPEYSPAMQAINLKNRWDYFYNANDGVPNTELLLGDMTENADLSSASALDFKDIRVLFKTSPKIEMVYTIFDENSIYKSSNEAAATTTIVRGYEFYEQSYALSSDRDFGLVFKINGIDTNITSKEGVLRDVSAGVNWSLTFGYDLTQAGTYPGGKQLLKPLRPICNTITNTPYTPIATSSWKKAIEDLNGFAAICHPETYKSENSSAGDLATFPLDQEDSFYDFFSYMSTKTISSDNEHKRVRLGHLYGIKSIQFRIEGCLKLYTRDASVAPINPNPWIQKNNESESCSSGPGDVGWMAYSLNKEISIFDDVDQYSTTPGLKELINNYNNSVPLNSVNFYFNNDVFYEHIY